MPLHTFFVQKHGNTYVAQATGNTVREAVEGWYKSSDTQPVAFDPAEEITPIRDREGVWCIDGRDAGEESCFCVIENCGPKRIKLFSAENQCRPHALVCGACGPAELMEPTSATARRA